MRISDWSSDVCSSDLIKTARPLDNPGFLANVGVKGVHDTTASNLPDSMQGDDLTGEISGIFSNTFADGKFGIALSGSYQERDFGYNEASVGGGWYAFPGGEGTDRKSTRLNSSHYCASRLQSSA